jgi:hypothetical protein
MDDIHGKTRMPGEPYGEVDQWNLKLRLYDVDNVMEPLQEACLEYLLLNPLGFFPPLHNPRHPIVALTPPLLIAKWKKYQEVSKVPHLCHQQ